jgi:ABC-type uncharacterized transport system involved in gliding motility auxiliary subunit
MLSDMINGIDPRRGGQPRTGNIAFLFNMIDDLAGSGNLTEARSRTSSQRPFSKLKKIQEDVTKDILEEQQKIEKDIETWQKELTSKMSEKDLQRGVIMVNQRDMADLQEKVEQGEKQKRELRKKFRKTVDGLFTKYQAANILGVPLLVLLIGFAVWLVGRSRMASR